MTMTPGFLKQAQKKKEVYSVLFGISIPKQYTMYMEVWKRGNATASRLRAFPRVWKLETEIESGMLNLKHPFPFPLETKVWKRGNWKRHGNQLTYRK
jgi:hypothetical protein